MAENTLRKCWTLVIKLIAKAFLVLYFLGLMSVAWAENVRDA